MANMKTFTMTDENGDEHEIVLPVKFVVCCGCEGAGKHVDPAVDGHGLSREDFDEDPDFRESYFAGHYDVRCETCKGDRVLPDVDREHADPEDLALFDECARVAEADARFERESYLERQAERNFGA